MSFSKVDQVFPIKPKAVSDAEFSRIVALALRHDFGDTPSAIKRIGQLTGANLRAIKNWYEARNTPSSGHLLLLARSSPTLLQFILKQIGGEDLWDAFSLLNAGIENKKTTEPPEQTSSNNEIYGAEYCTIKVSITPGVAWSLNQRQLWFLGILQQGGSPKAEDIVATWKVSIRAARYDVGELSKAGLIRFLGSKKKGKYEAV